MRYDSIAIVGVGLIGGSIGLAAQRYGLAREVIGVGRRLESLQIAKRVGAVTRVTTDLAEGVSGAQLAVVCTPVDSVAEHVRQAAAAGRSGMLLTDAGSTKAAIVAELAESRPPIPRFVGSHPMAGSHASGPASADADLFVDRVVIVTPTSATQPADCQEVEDFWAALRARIVRMSPAEHDRAVAGVSHVPHLVAAALMRSAPESDLQLAAGGLRDTTRIALGDAELWKQIALSNRGEVLQALARFEAELQSLRDALKDADPPRLCALLAQAQARRERLEALRPGDGASIE